MQASTPPLAVPARRRGPDLSGMPGLWKAAHRRLQGRPRTHVGRVGPSGSRATPDCYWSWLRIVLVVVVAAEVKPGEASPLGPGLMAGSSLGSRQASSSTGGALPHLDPLDGLARAGTAHPQGDHDGQALAVSHRQAPLAAGAQPRRRLVPRMPRVRKATERSRKSTVHGGAISGWESDHHESLVVLCQVEGRPPRAGRSGSSASHAPSRRSQGVCVA